MCRYNRAPPVKPFVLDTIRTFPQTKPRRSTNSQSSRICKAAEMNSERHSYRSLPHAWVITDYRNVHSFESRSLQKKTTDLTERSLKLLLFGRLCVSWSMTNKVSSKMIDSQSVAVLRFGRRNWSIKTSLWRVISIPSPKTVCARQQSKIATRLIAL